MRVGCRGEAVGAKPPSRSHRRPTCCRGTRPPTSVSGTSATSATSATGSRSSHFNFKNTRRLQASSSCLDLSSSIMGKQRPGTVFVENPLRSSKTHGAHPSPAPSAALASGVANDVGVDAAWLGPLLLPWEQPRSVSLGSRGEGRLPIPDRVSAGSTTRAGVSGALGAVHEATLPHHLSTQSLRTVAEGRTLAIVAIVAVAMARMPGFVSTTVPWSACLRSLVEMLLVAVAVVLAYASSTTSPFISYDDTLCVVGNTRIHLGGLAGLLQLWNPRDALNGASIEFFPLRDSVYWVLWQTFGANSIPFHVAGLFGHFAVALLVGRLAIKLGATRDTAFFAALIFAVHPVHIESVVWVAALKDPLYVAFLLASVVSYLSHLETGRPAAYVWSIVFLSASLLCKSLGIVAPLLFLIFERARQSPGPWRSIVKRLFLPSVITGGCLLLFLQIGHANSIILGPWGGSWFTHYQIVLWIAARYLQQTLVPMDFRLFYCFTMAGSGLLVRALAGAVVVAGYAATVFSVRKKHTAFILLAWFPVCLLPVMNIIPFQALMADRYTYAPSVAACIAGAFLLERLSPTLRKYAAICVVIVLGSVTAARASLWQDEPGLIRVIVEDEQCIDQAVPHVMLGDALAKVDTRGSLAEFHRAMNMPAFQWLTVKTQCLSHGRAAVLALRIDDIALAKKHIARALELCPTSSLVLNDASLVASRTGDLELEVSNAEQAASLWGDVGMIWNRGVARLHAGKVEEAAADLARAVNERPLVFCPLLRALADDAGGRLADPAIRSAALASQAVIAHRCASP